MLPQFFDMIGIRAQGVTFEAFFWALVLCAGLIVCVREFFAHRPFGDAWYGWAIGGLLAIFGGQQLYFVLSDQRLYFALEGLQVSNYGLAIALAFVVGIYLAVRESRRQGSVPRVGHILDLSFWVLIFSMVGSRVLFIIASWRDYYNLCVSPDLVEGSGGVQDCFAILRFWQGGLVFFGGFLGALGAGLWYCRKHDIKFLAAVDIAMPSLAIGHFFGRLGCLSAGCCYGRACDNPWAIAMPGHATQIHPTQLYESSAELLFFAILILMRPRKRFHGQVVATWLILYGLLRFTVEFYRGDKIRGYLFEVVVAPLNTFIGIGAAEPTILTTSQAISIGMAAAGVWLFARHRKRPTTSDAGNVQRET
jgi:phosphatidylglycerol:prolipoprotein diacylglycerol transferase